MSRHVPARSARRLSRQLAARVGVDLETSRAGLGLTIDEVARRAELAPSTVLRVLHGDPGAHLDTICAVGFGVGMRISVKAYPSEQPSLRDSGQLRMAQRIVGQAHPSLHPALELAVGDPFGRAADVVLFGPEEIIHMELERRIVDLQDPLRGASVKRDALQAKHTRPVHLVLAIEDTRRNRALVAAHATLIATTLPAQSREIMNAIRTGRSLGKDGLLWVRPWDGPSQDHRPAVHR
jgi:transcriptional regulator with XRE-family HTH domain